MKGRQGTLEKFKQVQMSNTRSDRIFCTICLLCCPELTPQMVGATVVAPSTVKVLSVQVPAVGGAVVNETKSSL
jgi:hypothetical protein